MLVNPSILPEAIENIAESTEEFIGELKSGLFANDTSVIPFLERFVRWVKQYVEAAKANGGLVPCQLDAQVPMMMVAWVNNSSFA